MSTPTSTLRRRGFATLAAAACVAAVVLVPSGAGAAIVPTVPLGTTADYAVLAGQTVTNTGPSVLNGDLGVWPGSAVTGFGGAPNGTVNGDTNLANGPAQQAQSDLTVAYDNAAGRTLIGDNDGATPPDLGGLTLVGGVYATATGGPKGPLSLTNTLTLDGAGNPDSVFVFQTNSTLTMTTGSRIELIRGAQPCNVFWQVGSSATLRTGSVFVGNILALTSIEVQDGVTVQGRALARNGEVTLINDTFNPPVCAAQVPVFEPAPTTSTTTSTTSTTTSTTSTTVPATTTTTAVPVTTPVTTAPDGTPVAPDGTPVGGGGTAGPIAGPVAGAPVGPTGGGGTATGTPTGRITTSSATPGSPRGDLPRTGSSLGLTFLAGLTLITLGSGAVLVGRREG